MVNEGHDKGGMKEPLLEARSVSLNLAGFRLLDVSLGIRSGECFVLLGPSGAGKTVLLETLMGLHRPISGRVLLDGSNVCDLPPQRRQIAYVPQDLSLFPHMSVKENILFGARARGIPKEEQAARLSELCSLMGLDPVLDRQSISGLSQGERQRVALARALMVQPKLIFLDEPFSSLDGYLKRRLQIELKEIKRHTNVTVALVTHDQEEAFILADRIGVLIQGRLHQVGTPDELYFRPSTVEAARFLMHQNIFEAEVTEVESAGAGFVMTHEGTSLRAAGGSSLRRGQRIHFGIRPEEIAVIRPDRPLNDAVKDNLFHGSVTQVFERGGSHLVILDMDAFRSPVEVDVPNCSFRDMAIKVGDELQVSLKRDAIWFLDGASSPAEKILRSCRVESKAKSGSKTRSFTFFGKNKKR